MGTTVHGLPYPEPTDPVAAGAAAIRSLAEAVDPRLDATVVAPQVSNSFFATVAPHTNYQDTGMALTFAPAAGRRYRFTYTSNPYLPGGAQVVTYKLIYGSTTLRYWTPPALSTTVPTWVNFQHSAILGAIGSQTFKIQIAGSANTLIYDYGDPTYTRQFTVEDIGAL